MYTRYILYVYTYLYIVYHLHGHTIIIELEHQINFLFQYVYSHIIYNACILEFIVKDFRLAHATVPQPYALAKGFCAQIYMGACNISAHWRYNFGRLY